MEAEAIRGQFTEDMVDEAPALIGSRDGATTGEPPNAARWRAGADSATNHTGTITAYGI